MRPLAGQAKPVTGALVLAVGLASLFRWHPIAEAWLIDHLPPWLIGLCVTF
jgi:cytochrome c-type biogenesis protein